MKKIIFLFAFIACTNIISAQSIKGLSVSGLYSGTSLHVESALRVGLTSKIDYNIRFASNFNYSTSFRTGLGYQLFLKGKLSFPVGLEYHLEHRDLEKFSAKNVKEHNIEIPVGVQFQTTDRLNINADLVPSINLDGNRSNRTQLNFRLGLEYRF